MVDRPDYEVLLENYKKLQVEVESVNQALHECRIRSQAMLNLEQEYQEEISILQLQGTEEVQKLKVKVRQLEEAKASMQSSFNDRLEYLETELSAKEEEILSLKQQTADVPDKEQSMNNSIVFCEIMEMKQENDDLRDKVEALERSLEKERNQIETLQATVVHLHGELENYKEILQCKKQELDETKTLAATLRDDYDCLKAELDTLKNRPLDEESKGNSLFAEVNDSRVELLKKYNLLKNKFLEMNRERASLLKRVNSASSDNISIIARWEKEMEQKTIDEEGIIASYKDQVRTLTELNEEYKKKLATTTPSPASMRFYDTLLEQKNKEIHSLNEKLILKVHNNLTLSYDITDANRKNRQFYLENMKLNEEKRQLEAKNVQLEMAASTIEREADIVIEESPVPKSIVKQMALTDITKDNIDNVTTTGCKKVESDKENIQNVTKRAKKVEFSAETVETQPENRATVRKGAKILKVVPIKY